MNSDAESALQCISINVVGDAYADLSCLLENGLPVPGGDSRLKVPVETMAGGSAVNTTTHLNALVRNGCEFTGNSPPLAEVKLHASVNPNDSYGKLLINHASKHDYSLIDCRKDGSKCATGHCIVVVANDDRSFMSHPGCNQEFEASDVDIDALVRVPSSDSVHHLHIHVAGFYNLSGFWHGPLKEMLTKAREERLAVQSETTTTISLVPQHDASEEWNGGILDLLHLVDFLILNDLEANGISRREANRRDSDTDSDDATIQEWASFFDEVSPSTYIIVTRGAHGAVALRRGKVIAMQSAVNVELVDPTGAGDAFCAGFLYGMWLWQQTTNAGLQDGWPIESIRKALCWGCSVASCSVMTRGASVPSSNGQIQEMLEKASKL